MLVRKKTPKQVHKRCSYKKLTLNQLVCGSSPHRGTIFLSPVFTGGAHALADFDENLVTTQRARLSFCFIMPFIAKAQQQRVRP